MQARNTYADPVQHHLQHLTSLLTLALALVGKAAMPAVQGHSLHSVASLGRQLCRQLAIVPVCVSMRGRSVLLSGHSASQGASNSACGPMPTLSEHWRAPSIFGQLEMYTFCGSVLSTGDRQCYCQLRRHWTPAGSTRASCIASNPSHCARSWGSDHAGCGQQGAGGGGRCERCDAPPGAPAAALRRGRAQQV